MPKRLHVGRALSALAVAPLAVLLACASGGARGTGTPSGAAARDTSAPAPEGMSIEQMLAARFPGVLVTPTDDGGLQIRVRGGASTFGGVEGPLYVIDDAPQPPNERGVVYVNPHDIAKIEVLKNPADTGVYGVRGAGGVIRITTKRSGSKP